METKTFIVTHPHAREPLTIEGKTLTKALKKERLNPDIWKEAEPIEPEPEAPDGQDN